MEPNVPAVVAVRAGHALRAIPSHAAEGAPRAAPSLRALPAVPNPSFDECAARRHWWAINIAVAWELARAFDRVHPSTFVAARDHAVARIPREAALPEAEAIATAAAHEYLARRRGIYAPWVVDPDWDLLPSPAWRDAVISAVTPFHEAVFRLHFGDGVPLDELAARLKVDASWLRPAREAVRELVRTVVAEDGVSTEGWDSPRVDRLVARVALAAGSRCPGPGGMGTVEGRTHGDNCPRCSRAFRLFRDGVLAPGHLFTPSNDVPVPALGDRLVCIQVQPDNKRGLRTMSLLFPKAVTPNNGVFVMPFIEGFDVPLREACEAGLPAREHIRLVVLDAPGRIEDGVVIGLAYEALRESLGGLQWGEAKGVEALPAALPPPPSAARYWAAAGLITSLAMAAAYVAFRPPSPEETFALSGGRFADAVVFDTDDAAWVDVLSISESRSEVVFHSDSMADKASLATGDGRFRIAVDERAVLVIAADQELEGTVGIAARADDVGEARDLIRAQYPSAAVIVVR